MQEILCFLMTTAVCFVLISVGAYSARPATIFVGLGGQHGTSTNTGAIGALNPSTGAITVIGAPVPGTGISGLMFTSNGDLWGFTQNGGGKFPPPGPATTSDLIQINPTNGALISSSLITAGGTPVSTALPVSSRLQIGL